MNIPLHNAAIAVSALATCPAAVHTTELGLKKGCCHLSNRRLNGIFFRKELCSRHLRAKRYHSSLQLLGRTRTQAALISSSTALDGSNDDLTVTKATLCAELLKVAPNGLEANADEQAKIAKLVTKLESKNPTSTPARSELMGGFWRMLYTDMEPAPSSGKLGPFIGAVYQDLRPEEDQILNLLKVGFPPIRGGLTADLQIISDDTWRITFDNVQQFLGPFKVQTKVFDKVTPEVRLWKVTFLDDDIRVLRAKKEDASDEESFIFVMERSEPERFVLGE